jgi:hypothetical protein
MNIPLFIFRIFISKRLFSKLLCSSLLNNEDQISGARGTYGIEKQCLERFGEEG